ncbi:maleylpyruvate isomerase family mycothiol-dependent enzyme [Spirillospora sp. NPDC048911]|uniref:maleylpyruvate isomerase family mycothiol-dependent enzyme n=1 Tax=Spirillospora sp. NPDC048911 TaxID=3364527 RepID=UPI003719E1DB
MNAAEAAALQSYSAGLLEGAIGFALAAVDEVTSADLARPTPCRGWNLRMLFLHVNDSLDALYEGIDRGTVALFPDGEPDGPGTDLIASFQERARRLLSAWTGGGEGHADNPGGGEGCDGDGGGNGGGPGARRLVTVAGCPMRAGAMAGTGAMEIAVHGWDVSRACGKNRQIPPELARRLLRTAPMIVGDDVRHGLFAPPVAVPPDASPGDRLVGFLGRDPGWTSVAAERGTGP